LGGGRGGGQVVDGHESQLTAYAAQRVLAGQRGQGGVGGGVVGGAERRLGEPDVEHGVVSGQGREAPSMGRSRRSHDAGSYATSGWSSGLGEIPEDTRGSCRSAHRDWGGSAMMCR